MRYCKNVFKKIQSYLKLELVELWFLIFHISSNQPLSYLWMLRCFNAILKCIAIARKKKKKIKHAAKKERPSFVQMEKSISLKLAALYRKLALSISFIPHKSITQYTFLHFILLHSILIYILYIFTLFQW